jgi:hypothetical protein
MTSKEFFSNIHWVGLGYGATFLLLLLYRLYEKAKSKVLSNILGLIAALGAAAGIIGMLCLGGKAVWILIGFGLVPVTVAFWEWWKHG